MTRTVEIMRCPLEDKLATSRTTRRVLFAADTAPQPKVHVLAVVALLTFLVPEAAAGPPGDAVTDGQELIEGTISPLLAEHCTHCHGGKQPQAGLSLEVPLQLASLRQHHEIWVKVLRRTQSREMPPSSEPPLETTDRQLLKTTLVNMLSNAAGFRDPGRVTIRRLNRAEYANTIRDLFGLDFAPPDDFPADDVGYDFDNIGDVLSLSPLLMEKYLRTADNIARSVILVPESIQEPSTRITALNFQGGVASGAKGRVLFAEGRFTAEHEFPRDGIYLLKARTWAQQAGPEPARMTFRIHESVLKVIEVLAEPSDPQIVTAWAEVPGGKHSFSVSFDNDYYRPDDPDPGDRDRNLWLEYLEVVGPMDETMPMYKLPQTHRRIVHDDVDGILHDPGDQSAWSVAVTDETANQILNQFASRAYRRPATDREVERLLRLVRLAERSGGSFERGLQLAIQAVLVSPKFLFLGEFDPAPDDPRSVRPLSEYELASRLAYFLWSSMPDRELMDHARQGSLRENLQSQVLRMLQDPKSRSLVDNFAGQWLQLRDLADTMIDAQQYPEFDDQLRSAMRTETEMFLASIIREDRSVLELIDGKYTFVNERLARHYGIEAVEGQEPGEEFRRVHLDGVQRSGVLTHASILTLTSNPTRTSPVKRGKWILKQFLGAPPPPPPPGADELAEENSQTESATLRQRLEVHRAKETCAVCHARMDPLGFSLENYDAIGRWRNRDGDHAIDAHGALPDGRQFDGSAGLKEILKSDVDQFRWCLAEKMLIFALGRGIEYYDYLAVDEITQAMETGEDRFSALMTAVVRSHPFQFRRGDGGEP